MRTIKVYCKKCYVSVTSNLIEVHEEHLKEEVNQNTIDFNSFSVTTVRGIKQIIVAVDDYHLVNHHDKKRFQGCCGSSGLDGLNKLCANGHELATEVSDCWLPHYIAFDLNKVIVKEIISDYKYKIVKF